jgi:hypothetical protein
MDSGYQTSQNFRQQIVGLKIEKEIARRLPSRYYAKAF